MQLQVSENTILRTWGNEDAPTLFALVNKNRQMLQPWLPWVPAVTEVKDSQKFIQDSSSDPHSERGLELGIWYHNKLAGCLGLHEISKTHNRTSLGYWLGEEYQGKGIMTNSVKTLTHFCFEELTLNRIEIRAAVKNIASQKVAKRLGFRFEGTLREVELIDGQYLDQNVYSKIRKDV